MAQTIPGFPAEAFRTGIRLAMTIGTPPAEDDYPLFVFPRQVTNALPADGTGLPFDPAGRPVVATPTTVRVLCAVEFDDASGKVENMGVIIPSAVKLTFLDEEYAQVKGFHHVILGGDRYYYRFTEPPLGMDVVGVWIIHCVAEDDS